MNKSFLRLGAFIAALAASANILPAQTIVQWASDDGGNDHYYQAVATPGGINWTDAAAAATTAGGYLATLTSAAENTFVFNLVNNSQFWVNDLNNSNGPWLGGLQLPSSSEPSGGWVWLNNDGAFVYTNWLSPTLPGDPTGEPNNNLGNEDRLEFFAEGLSNMQATWNDNASGNLTHGYVVEYNISPVPEPGLSAVFFGLVATGLGLIRRHRKSDDKNSIESAI